MFYDPRLVNQPAYYETAIRQVPAHLALAHPPIGADWKPYASYPTIGPDGIRYTEFSYRRYFNIYGQVLYL